ncbi:unnamed protein product [Spirodela intermedia]|uniref:Uncharacterized protein n=1 Tax=Spirodela intermedia TaxID=51605 RepID=A0A7I8JW68_SPIIN|nr:unnamed protein product [Spirodela intermedia]
MVATAVEWRRRREITWVEVAGRWIGSGKARWGRGRG